MLAASACSETEFEVVEDSEASWMLLECDPIAPSVCGFPFPSNVYTVADDSTPTGRRLELSRALLPASYYGVSPSPQPWNQGDGFSASSAIMTHFPGLTQSSLAASNVATPATIDRSMEFDSPTILIDGVDPDGLFATFAAVLRAHDLALSLTVRPIDATGKTVPPDLDGAREELFGRRIQAP